MVRKGLHATTRCMFIDWCVVHLIKSCASKRLNLTPKYFDKHNCHVSINSGAFHLNILPPIGKLASGFVTVSAIKFSHQQNKVVRSVFSEYFQFKFR